MAHTQIVDQLILIQEWNYNFFSAACKLSHIFYKICILFGFYRCNPGPSHVVRGLCFFIQKKMMCKVIFSENTSFQKTFSKSKVTNSRHNLKANFACVTSLSLRDKYLFAPILWPPENLPPPYSPLPIIRFPMWPLGLPDSITSHVPKLQLFPFHKLTIPHVDLN